MCFLNKIIYNKKLFFLNSLYDRHLLYIHVKQYISQLGTCSKIDFFKWKFLRKLNRFARLNTVDCWIDLKTVIVMPIVKLCACCSSHKRKKDKQHKREINRKKKHRCNGKWCKLIRKVMEGKDSFKNEMKKKITRRNWLKYLELMT